MSFVEVLSSCGLEFSIPSEDGSANSADAMLCAVHPAKLRARLHRKLLSDRSLLDGFMIGLEEHMADSQFLQRSLQPLSTPDDLASKHRSSGESLCKVLLGVDVLQKNLVSILMEQLPLKADEATDKDERTLNLPRLLLKQLRWLEHIVDGRALAEKLLECLQVCPLAMQREIIFCLPDVICDQEHAMIVSPLRELQHREPALLVAILDTYSNLSLPDHMLGSIVLECLDLLESTNAENLPVLVRFLLLTSSSENLNQVVDGLRHALKASLDVCSTDQHCPDGDDGFTQEEIFLSRKSTRQQSGNRLESETFGALTLDALRHGLQFKDSIAKAFLHDIQKGSSRRDHSAADVWILVILFSIPQHSKRVVQVFRQKVLKSHFTDALIIDAVKGRSATLNLLFSDLLKLCSSMLRCREHFARRCGVYLYIALFREFREPFQRGEIVPALTQHCGSGDSKQCDSALEVLLKIALPLQTGETNDLAEGLKPYAIFIRGLLDYVHFLTDSQVRSIFQVLCFLNVDSSGECVGHAPAMDEVHIIIRKHLARASLDFKRVGLIGAVAYVSALGHQRLPPCRRSSGTSNKGGAVRGVNFTDCAAELEVGLAEDGSASLEDIPTESERPQLEQAEPEKQEIANMLLLVSRSCRDNPGALAFLFDELTLAVTAQRLGSHVIKGLRQAYTGMLEDHFLDEYAKGTDPSQEAFPGAGIRAQLYFNLDDEDAAAFVPFLHCLANSNPAIQTKVTFACPLLRFIAECLLKEDQRDSAHANPQELNSATEALYSLLGAPLQLASEGTISAFRELTLAEKQWVAMAHWLAVNWIRELLNIFCLSNELEVQAKLICRFQNLCELQKDLLTMVKMDPKCLPLLEFVLEKKTMTSSIGRGQQKRGGKKAVSLLAKLSPLQVDARLNQALSETYRPLRHEVLTCLSLQERVVLALKDGFIPQVNEYAAAVADVCKNASSAMPTKATEMLLRKLNRQLRCSLNPTQQGGGFPGARRKVLRQDESSDIRSFRGNRQSDSQENALHNLEVLSALIAEIPYPQMSVCNSVDLMHLLHAQRVFASLRRTLDRVRNLLLASENLLDDEDHIEPLDHESFDDLDQWLPCLDLCMEAFQLVCTSTELWAVEEGRQSIQKMLNQFLRRQRCDESGADDAIGDVDDDRVSCFARTFEDSFIFFHEISECVRNIGQAVLMLQTLEALANAGLRDLYERNSSASGALTDSTRLTALHHVISEDALWCLSKDWTRGNPKFRYRASDLGLIVQTFLKFSREPLAEVERMGLDVLPGLTCTPKCEGPAEGFPSLTAISFVHYHGALLQCLTFCWQNTDFSGEKEPRERSLLILRARRMVHLFRYLVVLTKNNKALERNGILKDLLKESRPFVESFIRSMSVFQEWCGEELLMEDVSQNLFRPLQSATRHLQSICAYAKQTRNEQLSREVPAMKRVLEQFIFRIRVFAKAVGTTVQVSNLKNRGIDGTVRAVRSSSEDEEGEEEGEEGEEEGEEEGDEEGDEEENACEGDEEYVEDAEAEDEKIDCEEAEEGGYHEAYDAEEDMDHYDRDLLAEDDDEETQNEENIPPNRKRLRRNKPKHRRRVSTARRFGLSKCDVDDVDESPDARDSDENPGDETILLSDVMDEDDPATPLSDQWFTSQQLL